LLIEQPAKVATPLLTVTGFVVQLRIAVGSPPVNASVTEVVLSVVTTLPPASSTETTGCCANALPAVAVLLGSVCTPAESPRPT
jgi:hypothetical protein